MPKQTQLTEYISNIPEPPYRPPTQSRTSEVGPYRDIYYGGSNEACLAYLEKDRLDPNTPADNCYRYCTAWKSDERSGDDDRMLDPYRTFDYPDGAMSGYLCGGDPECLDERRGNCSCGNRTPCPNKLIRDNGYIPTACKIICCIDKCRARPSRDPAKPQ